MLMIKDLTVGEPRKILWKFSFPIFLSAIFQQLYNIIDSIIAGKFAGEQALASVGASYPITMVFMSIAIGINFGASVLIARYFGAKKYEKMKSAISTTFIGTVILAVILTLVGVFTSKYMLALINTPEEIMQDSDVYLKIYIGGLLFLFIYNVVTGVFASLGDSRTPLIFLIMSSVLNIVLDLVFVIVCGWGVAGVAWATFIAQGLACIFAASWLIVKLRRIKTGKFRFYSNKMMAKVIRYSMPSILQQSFISIGNIFVQSIINSFGASVIAGYSAAVKLNTFCMTSIVALTNGMTSFTSQNVGAGKYDRINKAFKSEMVMCFSVAAFFIVLYLSCSSQLINLFLKEGSAEAVNTGVLFTNIITPCYLLVVIKIVADGTLRGLGKMTKFMISTFSDLILRVVLSFAMYKSLGILGVFLSWPIGWFVGMLFAIGFYIKERKTFTSSKAAGKIDIILPTTYSEAIPETVLEEIEKSDGISIKGKIFEDAAINESNNIID